MVDELPLCLRIIFVHIFDFFDDFLCTLSVFLSCVEITTYETPKSSLTHILRWIILEEIGMIPQQFSSNENKKLVRECTLFSINFDVLNTTQHYTHIFPIYHSYTSDTCWWHNKMSQCQIFIALTALVHHLLSEIRILYLYTR